MKRLALSMLLGLVAATVQAAGTPVTLTGTWAATTGLHGKMIFESGHRLVVAPDGFAPVKTHYILTDHLLEIRPDDGRQKSTVYLHYKDARHFTMRYEDGDVQQYVRVK